MVYSEFDLEALEEDEAVPDDPKDIRPWVGGSKQRGLTSSSEHADNQGGEDDEENDDEDWDGNDDFSEWNIRKCSAAGLDILSTVFEEEILPTMLPLLQQRLNDQANWTVRESAILALGAIAEGCSHGMKQHLAGLVPYLLALLSDAQVFYSYISILIF
jgi:hypothetical protein